MLGVVNERPAWVDIPPPSAGDQIAAAERLNSSLRTVADKEIVWRQDAVDAGIATETESSELQAWKLYRVHLMRVDVTDPI